MYKKDLWFTTIASFTPRLPVPWRTTIEKYSLRAAKVSWGQLRAAKGSRGQLSQKGFFAHFWSMQKKQIMWNIYSGFLGIFLFTKRQYICIHFADEIYYCYAKIKLTISSFVCCLLLFLQSKLNLHTIYI